MTATAFTQNTATLAPAHWTGISLDELNAKAAMQTRVDRKYIVDGPSTGGNGATDAAGGLTITGGTLIQGDSGDMFEGMEGAYAQFSASVSSGDTVTVTNSSGEVVAEYTSTKTISQVVVAGSSITEGETYTISVNGSEAGTATATSGAAAGGMGGMAPGGRP